jgi:hypothetical protein
LEALLGDLEKNRFSGYVQLIAWEFKGTMLINAGKLANVSVEEKQEPRGGGMAALECITAKAQDKDAVVNVHALPERIVETLVCLGQSESVHKGLDSDFVSLDKLTAKLQSDQYTRYIQVLLKEDLGYGCVTLRPGEPAQCDFLTDSKLSNDPSALPELIDTAKLGATFEVYQEALEKKPSPNDGAELSLMQSLRLWDEILANVEAAIDGATGKGRFQSAFQRALADKAHQYLFLDPQTKNLIYKESHLTYRGGWDPQFNRALSNSLSATVTKLAAETARAKLTLKTKAALQTLVRKYPTEIQALAAETRCDLFHLLPYEQVILEAQPFLSDRTEDFIARQCREHLRIEPQALGVEQLGDLAHWVHASARLFIAPDKAQALYSKLEALALKTPLPEGGKK